MSRLFVGEKQAELSEHNRQLLDLATAIFGKKKGAKPRPDGTIPSTDAFENLQAPTSKAGLENFFKEKKRGR